MLFYSGFCTEVEFNLLYYIDQHGYSNVAFCDLTKNNRTHCSLFATVSLIKRSSVHEAELLFMKNALFVPLKMQNCIMKCSSFWGEDIWMEQVKSACCYRFYMQREEPAFNDRCLWIVLLSSSEGAGETLHNLILLREVSWVDSSWFT